MGGDYCLVFSRVQAMCRGCSYDCARLLLILTSRRSPGIFASIANALKLPHCGFVLWETVGKGAEIIASVRFDYDG